MSARLFHSFSGFWTFERLITGSQVASASGTARFTQKTPGILDYREEGEMRGVGSFYREYQYRLENDKVNVYFEDGTFFHRLCIGEPCTHHCGSDRYTLEYAISPDIFRVSCAVLGPQKNYCIATEFSRDVAKSQEA